MEEIERVRGEIFQLEMKGVITPRQKAAVQNELQTVLNGELRKRDALKVQDIQEVQKRLDHIRVSKPPNLLSYLKEVFIEGQRAIFTLFDVLAILLFLLPIVAPEIVANVPLTRTIGGAIFFISFLWANYTLYKNYQN